MLRGARCGCAARALAAGPVDASRHRVEKFALIWLSVIAFLMIGVLFTVSPIVGALATGSAVLVFFGFRLLRRDRQLIRRIYPDREHVVEPEDGGVPDESSHHRAS